MSTKTELLKLLKNAGDEYISGQDAGDKLNVTRNAVWKAVNSLREDGYKIESRSNLGYRLDQSTNALTYDGVEAFVNVPCKMQVLQTVTSTNDLVKQTQLSEMPIVIIANRQTAGRGRLGRRFESPGGTGLYMSFGFKPKFDMEKAPMVTMAAAVATCRAMDRVCGIKTSIKWVNDIFYNGKKCCGILTEAQSDLENGRIDNLICGIGVNCFPGSFPPELEGVAGALSDEPGSFSRNELAAAMVNEFISILSDVQDGSFLDEYRERCFITGQLIRVHPNYNDKGTEARALEVEDDGGLLVVYTEGEKKGLQEVLHTGEISISLV
jgi:BirA family biotin operon repressor/biotin-[acetyl-CoA-carboxylase] ligase